MISDAHPSNQALETQEIVTINIQMVKNIEHWIKKGQNHETHNINRLDEPHQLCC
ncbi:MAG: hypothetical protein DID92_2727743596 [Candidatus Nitrotoga sp. SPKER]|nr:MAG: hypothetical protein DID92_2727743596 [Candidatus Nitrotoga sp. SPKER]